MNTNTTTDEIVTVEAMRFPAAMRAEVAGPCDHLEIAIDTIQPVLADAWRMTQRIDAMHSAGPEAIELATFHALAEAAGLPADQLNLLLCRLQNMVEAIDNDDPAAGGRYLAGD